MCFIQKFIVTFLFFSLFLAWFMDLIYHIQAVSRHCKFTDLVQRYFFSTVITWYFQLLIVIVIFCDINHIKTKCKTRNCNVTVTAHVV